MTASLEKLVLTVPSSKLAGFLEMLRQYDFVQVSKLDEIISRFIRTAPKKPAMTDEEIVDILMEVRYGKQPSATDENHL